MSNIIETILNIEKEFNKKRAVQAEERARNNKAWEHVEKELSKKVGSERSNAYNTYKGLSASQTPIGSGLYNQLVKEMTEEERKLVCG